MVRLRLSLGFAAALLVLSVGACQKPTSVGEDLVGGLTGTPRDTVFYATSFSVKDEDDLTSTPARVLAGRVNDPLLGTVSATAYLDFSPSSEPGKGFSDGPVQSVQLRLVPDYVYGDTTAHITFQLWDLADQIADSVRTDEMPAASDLIGQFDVSAADSMILIDLPAQWVAKQDTALRSQYVATSFDGIKVAPLYPDANVVLGFRVASSAMRVVSGGDTLNFPLTRRAYTTKRETPPSVGSDRLLLQDGLRPAASFSFAFDPSAALLPQALNRVVMIAQVDTVALRDTPPNFVRPILTSVSLYAVTEAGDEIYIADYNLDSKGRVIFFTAPPSAGSLSLLTTVVQQMLLGLSPVDHFLMRAPVGANTITETISPLLFYGADTPEAQRPRAVVTLTPIE